MFVTVNITAGTDYVGMFRVRLQNNITYWPTYRMPYAYVDFPRSRTAVLHSVNEKKKENLNRIFEAPLSDN
jgi:hypothetical protein